MSTPSTVYRCCRCRRVLGKRSTHYVYGRKRVMCGDCRLPQRPLLTGDRAAVAAVLDRTRNTPTPTKVSDS